MEVLSKMVDEDACDGDDAGLITTLGVILAERFGNA